MTDFDHKQQSVIVPQRMIHLDFHTGPQIPDVAAAFDPDAFARNFREAHVDSVTVFAKCHHGHLYYQTDRPERHPHLPPGLDLLRGQIDALHEVGIRAPIYLSVQCDEYAARIHPQWAAVNPDGTPVQRPEMPTGWTILDMSSPYQDYFAEQLQEVLERFAPTDGIFLDMCWDQPSMGEWAVAGMKKRGYDPRDPDHRARYAREVAHEYMGRYRDMVEAAHQPSAPAGIWFNSRPKTQLHVEKKFLRHVEVECLPTGGWGYAYFPYVSRYVRSVAQLPTLSMTGRFFKSWGDNASLKPMMALKYECCQAMSQGMGVGVGDLLHPSGAPSPAVYDLIGSVYSYIEACQDYTEGGRLLSQIAVLVEPELGDDPAPAALGAVRALQQLQHQFDIVPVGAEIGAYDLVLVPENIRIDAPLRQLLGDYLRAGGALIVSGTSALDAAGEPALPELGIVAHGVSPFSHTFLHAGPEISRGLADYGYVMYERGLRLQPGPDSEALAWVGEPYFERTVEHFSGHDYTPEGSVSFYAAVIRSGRAITFAAPIFEAYGKHAAPNYRTLLGNCIACLLPRPLVKANGPSRLETTVMQAGSPARRIVHLLSFSAERRADDLDIVEDAIPLVEMTIDVLAAKPPKRVFLAPSGKELPFRYEDGYVRTTITETSGHTLLVVE